MKKNWLVKAVYGIAKGLAEASSYPVVTNSINSGARFHGIGPVYRYWVRCFGNK